MATPLRHSGDTKSVTRNSRKTISTQENIPQKTNNKSTQKHFEALSEAEYNTSMARIETLMLKGSEHLSQKEFEELRTLSLIAQAYEQQHYVIEPPTTFGGVLERKMYELKLKQGELARLLRVSPAKLSLVISGKQKPDIALVKATYNELNVDAQLLLRVL